ncbi:extracellular solute-binding protein [soil metagenome]
MRSTRFLAIGATGLAAALVLAGCSAPSSSDSADQTLTVWAMNGDLSPDTIAAINAKFTEATGAKVNVQVQEWDDIITKVTTALSTSTPPDVVDIGNTQVPIYAANGGLMDLTSVKSDLEQGKTWLAGLEEPATQEGKLYGVPSFAGDRAVIYNKTMWAAAGVTDVPTTYADFTHDLDLVAAANPAADFSAFYYPGQYDFGPLGFVWDAGGEIAIAKDGVWTAGFSDAKAQKGLQQFKEFQNKYSISSSTTSSENDPEQSQILADGHASAILGISSEIDSIKKANPQLTDADLGTFPFPGVSGKSQPVMLGGSVWGIASKSKQSKLAIEWIKIAASPEIQADYVFGKDGWIPNSVEAIDAASASLPPLTAGFFQAAKISKATPAAADWPTIEGDHSLREFFGYVASGTKSVSDAAAEFDSHVESVLNNK